MHILILSLKIKSTNLHSITPDLRFRNRNNKSIAVTEFTRPVIESFPYDGKENFIDPAVGAITSRIKIESYNP